MFYLTLGSPITLEKNCEIPMSDLEKNCRVTHDIEKYYGMTLQPWMKLWDDYGTILWDEPMMFFILDCICYRNEVKMLYLTL